MYVRTCVCMYLVTAQFKRWMRYVSSGCSVFHWLLLWWWLTLTFSRPRDRRRRKDTKCTTRNTYMYIHVCTCMYYTPIDIQCSISTVAHALYKQECILYHSVIAQSYPVIVQSYQAIVKSSSLLGEPLAANKTVSLSEKDLWSWNALGLPWSSEPQICYR